MNVFGRLVKMVLGRLYLGIGKIVSPIRVLHENATVDNLIDAVEKKWRANLMQHIMLLMDSRLILQVHIRKFGGKDERVWAASEDVVFRVWDAYNLALQASVETSYSNGGDSLWQKLWALHIPPKAKIFLWRAARDILPHGSNLSKKGITNVHKCQRCGMIENSFYVLKDCYWARTCWIATSLNTRPLEIGWEP